MTAGWTSSNSRRRYRSEERDAERNTALKHARRPPAALRFGALLILGRRGSASLKAEIAARMETPRGRLVLCPTPLGNLEDITLRTLRELRHCDVIFAEDTRVTQKLLRHYGIKKPLRSFHERVERNRIRELWELLDAGRSVAVVTDAGMPGISDPGTALVAAAREAGAKLDALPGPSAAIGALTLSGFDVTRFRFDGFPPRKPAQRQEYLESLAGAKFAVVWYEAPPRVNALLDDVARVLPNRKVFVLREYTKMFEQQEAGSAADVRARIPQPPRGEFTIVLERAQLRGAEAQTGSARRVTAIPDSARDAIALLLQSGMSVKTVAESIRLATGLPKNALYRAAQEVKEQASRARRPKSARTQ